MLLQALMLQWLSRRRRRRYRVGSKDPRAWLRLAGWVVALTALHILAMAVFEGLTAFEGLWLTGTTIATVGYGDLSAKTVEGRLATMLLMYVGGVFVLIKAINGWLDAKADRVERQIHGIWDWTMDNHLLVIGNPSGESLDCVTDFFARLVAQIHADADWTDTPVLLFTAIYRGHGLPPILRDHRVVHYAGRVINPEELAAVEPAAARTVIVLAGAETDAASDALALDAVTRLRETGCTAHVIAECVDDRNRPRLLRAGASTVVRPMRGYPEMLARAVVAPGAEEIITDLFTAEGNQCRRIDLGTIWRGSWAGLAVRLLEGGIGTPIAYADPAGKVHTNPVGAAAIEAAALFVIVSEHETRGDAGIRALLTA